MNQNVEKPLYKDKNLHILNLISAISMMSNLLSPAFPGIADAFGVNPAQIGLLTTFYSIPMLLLSPVIGIVADRIGRKKVLGLSVFMFGLGGVLSFLTNSYTMLLFCSFLRGMGSPGMNVLLLVIVGDLYKEKERRTSVLGCNTAILNVALAAYPLLGGFLAGISWRAPFVVFLTTIPAALAVFFVMDEPKIEKKQQSILPHIRQSLALFKNPRIATLSVISFMVYLVLDGCFLTYVPFLMINVVKDPSMIGAIMSVMAVVSCGFSALLGPLSKRFSEETLDKAALLAFGISCFLGLKADTFMMAALFSAVFGIGVGLNMPAVLSMIIPLAPPEIRGAFVSIFNLVKRLGQTLGPLIFGLLFLKWGLPAIFMAGGIVSIATFIFAANFLKKEKSQED